MGCTSTSALSSSLSAPSVCGRGTQQLLLTGRAFHRPTCKRRQCAILATLDTTVRQLKSIIDPQPKVGDFANANFPVDLEGRTLHLGCKRGEVANRVLSVGSMDRALIIADQLDGPEPGVPLFQHLSGRGFLTITGLFKGVPVSIITTQMGMPNMDFVVRESRAVVDGQMAIVRLGTCGALRPPAVLGSLIVASPGAVCVRRDPDAWTHGDGRRLYTLSAPVLADPQLRQLLVQCCVQQFDSEHVVEGLNATADSFYSSQGRLGSHFDDGNEQIIEQLLMEHPELISLEMETFHLLDLARCSRNSIKAAAFCIAAAERYSNRFISRELTQLRERQGGTAALSALVACPLLGAVDAHGNVDDSSNGSADAGSHQHLPPTGGYVWAQKDRVATA